MFEALFILTTIDAGTRVGRFLMQDLLGKIWAPLGQTRSTLGNGVASAAFVAAWGWFLYAGVVDPLGGINSLWPIFGVANQLLAVLALALGTTVLIKMGRARYVWATVGPLLWLLAVTMTAGWMKIFSSDPRVGFLSAAAELKKKLAADGGSPLEQVKQWQHLLTNNYINTAVTGSFMVLVLLVVVVCAREWWLLLRKRREPVLCEEPYVALAAARVVR
jgi:carbon starvation protein